MGAPSPRPRLTARLVLARLALIVGSVVVLIGAAELITRWIQPATPLLLIPTAPTCMRRSASLSVDLIPDCDGMLSGTAFRTNAEGLRGPALRRDGARRILAMGDSCTWGWQVAEDESYPAVLQTLLDERPNGERFEVLNGGVPGYTSYQGLVALQESRLALRPAIVIAGFAWNDATPKGDIRRQIELENRYMRLIKLDDWLLQDSRFYRWARSRAAGSATSPEATAPRVAPLQSWENLDRMAASVAAQGGRMVFLDFLKPGVRANRHTLIAGVAEHWNAPVIVYDGPRIDLVHPTAEGYHRLAEQIVAAMDSYGYLDPAPTVAANPAPPAE